MMPATRGKPKVISKSGGRYTREAFDFDGDLSKLTYPELNELKLKVDEALLGINSQIHEAKVTHATEGTYADRKWYRNITWLSKRLGQFSQRIQYAQGAARRRQGAAGLPEQFMNVAEVFLDTETFERILSVAKREYGKRLERLSPTEEGQNDLS